MRAPRTLILVACLLVLASGMVACGNPVARARIADTEEKAASTPEAIATPVLPDRLRIPILMYHHIRVLSSRAGDDWREITVTPDEFAAQMSYLTEQGYQSVHFSDLLAYFDGGKPLPAKPVIITFDDAWEDGYETAYPILKKDGLTASFFVPANWITRVDGTLTWQQIEEMSGNGMEFGSHTMTHPFLTKEEPDKLAWELEASKSLLEEHIGKPVTVLAYPYGFYDDTVLEASRQAGYVAGLTIDRGIWATRDNLMTMRRVGLPYGISIKTFETVLNQPGEGEE
jgi:peptidoglycan/xylan/chitin deacetylase (PgdA/CDA1 family)